MLASTADVEDWENKAVDFVEEEMVAELTAFLYIKSHCTNQVVLFMSEKAGEELREEAAEEGDEMAEAEAENSDDDKSVEGVDSMDVYKEADEFITAIADKGDDGGNEVNNLETDFNDTGVADKVAMT